MDLGTIHGNPRVISQQISYPTGKKNRPPKKSSRKKCRSV
jgi:hypothetical protein